MGQVRLIHVHKSSRARLMGMLRKLHAKQGRVEFINKLRRDQRDKTPDKLKRVTLWSKQNNFPKAEKGRISLKQLRVLEEVQREKRMVEIKV